MAIKWDRIKGKRPAMASGVSLQKKGKDKDSDWIVFSTSTALACVVNSTGGEILRLCDGKRTVEGIAKSVSESRGVPEAQTRKDAAAFLNDMIKEGLVNW